MILFILQILVTLIFFISIIKLGKLKETHHGYYGILLYLMGWPLHGILGFILTLVGFLVTLDDASEHLMHALGHTEYKTPIFKFYERYLWPNPSIQKLTHWLDNLFGKKE